MKKFICTSNGPSNIVCRESEEQPRRQVASSSSSSRCGIPDPAQVSCKYRAGFRRFRVVDAKRPRIPGGEGRLLEVSVWYPVNPQLVTINSAPAGYGSSWLLPGDFIPDNEVQDDIAAGNLTGVPPLYYSPVALDGTTLPVSSKEKFPLVVIMPSATLPIWTIASRLAEVMATHGFIVIGVEALIGDGWRTRIRFPPLADPSNLDNRIADIGFIIDAMTNSSFPDPLLTHPNYLQDLAAFRTAIDKNRVGLYTSSGGGSPVFEYALTADKRLKAMVLYHSRAFTLTPEELATITIPVLFQSGSLDTTVPPAQTQASYDAIGTPAKDKYLINVLGAVHFDAITCEAANGFYRATAAFMTSTFAINTSNLFANVYDSVCLNQTDITSDDVRNILVREAVSFFKVYLSRDSCYQPFILSCDGLPTTNQNRSIECAGPNQTNLASAFLGRRLANLSRYDMDQLLE